MQKTIVSLCLLAVCSAAAVAQQAPPVSVSPYDANLRYTGRFDRRDPLGPRCSWAGSAVWLAFDGPSVTVRLQDDAREEYFRVVLDGHDSMLQTNPGVQVYPLAQDLAPGPHVLQLTKRTEPLVGTTQWLGFELAPGAHVLHTPPAPRRRIEFIGDSITCGYGDEGKDQHDHFAARTENNCITYEALAAQKLDFDYTCIAWSGRKLAGDNTMREIYDRILPADPTSLWHYADPPPDAVLIDLCTNDFGSGGCPDRKMWTDAYVDFVHEIQGHYPSARIICAIGSMMTDTWPPGQHQLSVARSYVQQVVAELRDGRVTFLEFPVQQEADGYGSDFHPSRKTHEIMAQVLDNELHRDLHW